MSTWEKSQPIFILLSVVLGLLLGQISWVSESAGTLVVPFLMLMLAGVFLHVPLRGLARALEDLRFTGWNLEIKFLWTPPSCEKAEPSVLAGEFRGSMLRRGSIFAEIAVAARAEAIDFARIWCERAAANEWLS